MGLSFLLGFIPKMLNDMFSKLSSRNKILMFIAIIVIINLSAMYTIVGVNDEVNCKKCPDPFVYVPSDELLHMSGSKTKSDNKRKDSH